MKEQLQIDHMEYYSLVPAVNSDTDNPKDTETEPMPITDFEDNIHSCRAEYLRHAIVMRSKQNPTKHKSSSKQDPTKREYPSKQEHQLYNKVISITNKSFVRVGTKGYSHKAIGGMLRTLLCDQDTIFLANDRKFLVSRRNGQWKTESRAQLDQKADDRNERLALETLYGICRNPSDELLSDVLDLVKYCGQRPKEKLARHWIQMDNKRLQQFLFVDNSGEDEIGMKSCHNMGVLLWEMHKEMGSSTPETIIKQSKIAISN